MGGGRRAARKSFGAIHGRGFQVQPRSRRSSSPQSPVKPGRTLIAGDRLSPQLIGCIGAVIDLSHAACAVSRLRLAGGRAGLWLLGCCRRVGWAAASPRWPAAACLLPELRLERGPHSVNGGWCVCASPLPRSMCVFHSAFCIPQVSASFFLLPFFQPVRPPKRSRAPRTFDTEDIVTIDEMMTPVSE